MKYSYTILTGTTGLEFLKEALTVEFTSNRRSKKKIKELNRKKLISNLEKSLKELSNKLK